MMNMKTEATPLPNYASDRNPQDGVQPWSRGVDHPWSLYCIGHCEPGGTEGAIHPNGRKIEVHYYHPSQVGVAYDHVGLLIGLATYPGSPLAGFRTITARVY
jgi:hypothetical protein